MNLRNAIVVLVTLALGAAPAYAGKGVKKNAVEHRHHGRVIAIHHHPKKGEMTVTIKVHHHKKKNVAAVAAPAVVGVKHHHAHRSFHVTRGTAVEVVRGSAHQPATAAAIHKGAHVSIHAHQHMADKVAVHHKKA